MKRKIGTFFLVIGIIFFLAALSLFVWNEKENWQAEKMVNVIVPQIEEIIDETGLPYQVVESDEMKTVIIDGNEYIGYLNIPRFGLQLPIMTDWSYPKLKISPCRYTGSVKNDDMVVAAHNYSRHFGKLKSLDIGDEVLFTDVNGVEYRYVVAEVTTLQPTAITEMTSSSFDLTLFTCTYGGQSRVTVRCNRR